MTLGNNVKCVNIYHKVSNLNKPFWGLTKNRLDQLKNEDKGYYVRFDCPKGSITLTSDQVNVLLRNKKVAVDGDYKITMDDISAIIRPIL